MDDPTPFQGAPNPGATMIEAFAKAAAEAKIGKSAEAKPAEAPKPPKEEAKPTETETKTEAKAIEKKPKVAEIPEKPAKADDSASSTDEPKPGSKEFNYKALENKATQAAKEAADLKRQLQEAKAALENNEWKSKAEVVAKEKEELSQRLMQASLERHPKFQEHYNKQFAATAETIKKMVPGSVGEKIAKAATNGTIEELIGEPAIEDALSSLPASKSGIVSTAIARAIELHKERENALANPSVHLEDAAKAEQAKRADFLSKANTVFEAVKAKAVANIPVFQEREGDAAWNADVKHSLDAARDVFGDVTQGNIGVDDLSKLVLWGQAAPKLYETVNVQLAMISELTQKIKAMEAAQPGIKPSAQSATKTAPKSFLEAISETLANKTIS